MFTDIKSLQISVYRTSKAGAKFLDLSNPYMKNESKKYDAPEYLGVQKIKNLIFC